MKFAYLMPLDRIRAMMASQGIVISSSTLSHLIEHATDLVNAVDGEHMKQLKSGKYLCFDGTGLSVLHCAAGCNEAVPGGVTREISGKEG